jgi:hypothetical protein
MIDTQRLFDFLKRTKEFTVTEDHLKLLCWPDRAQSQPSKPGLLMVRNASRGERPHCSRTTDLLRRWARPCSAIPPATATYLGIRL